VISSVPNHNRPLIWTSIVSVTGSDPIIQAQLDADLARHRDRRSLLHDQAQTDLGASEVGVELPPWMMGSLPVTETIEVQSTACS